MAIRAIKFWAAALVMAFCIGGTIIASNISQPVFAAEASDSCNSGFLGFPAWYRGVTDGDCNIKSPTSDELPSFIWKIVLNIIDMALMAVGYIAVFFILWGGFSLIINSGSSDALAKARQTVFNAIIGLVISIAAVAIVRYISGII